MNVGLEILEPNIFYLVKSESLQSKYFLSNNLGNLREGLVERISLLLDFVGTNSSECCSVLCKQLKCSEILKMSESFYSYRLKCGRLCLCWYSFLLFLVGLSGFFSRTKSNIQGWIFVQKQGKVSGRKW